MKIEISEEDARGLWVDRSGVLNGRTGRQGFRVMLGDVELHFEDEADAERLAVAICQRQGIGGLRK